MKRTYTLSTQDSAAFARLLDASAGLGTFSVHVVEIKPTPEASKPISAAVTPLRPSDTPGAA